MFSDIVTERRNSLLHGLEFELGRLVRIHNIRRYIFLLFLGLYDFLTIVVRNIQGARDLKLCSGGLTTFGIGFMTDIVLKDQLVVYDNQNQQLGWKLFDCKFLSGLHL